MINERRLKEIMKDCDDKRKKKCWRETVRGNIREKKRRMLKERERLLM